LFVSLAWANLDETLSASLETAQYHLSLAAMLFENIRNEAMEKPSA
jgi:hypothetical protein